MENLMDNIIFLDIDGVLLPFSAHNDPENIALKADCDRRRNELRHVNKDPFIVYNLRIPFSNSAVSLINSLAAELNAKIVINSDWYLYLSPDALLSKLAAEGIRKDYFHQDPIAERPRLTAGKLQCVEWWFECYTGLNENHNYVVIDDSLSSSINTVVSPHPDKGFTKYDYQDALKLFG
jgi:hypothetical protein